MTSRTRQPNKAKASAPASALQLLNHPLVLVVATLLCLLAIFSLQKSKHSATVSKESIEQLEQNVDQLELAKELQAAALASGESALAIEKIKRNELLQQKEGEIILQVPERELVSADRGASEKKNGPLEEWKSLFF